MADFEDDSFEDDIAYVSDEDDSRGPGCLSAMSLICGSIGILGSIGVVAWLISIDAFTAPAPIVQPNSIVLLMIVVMVGTLSFLSGAIGLGMGLYAERFGRLSRNPAQTKSLARTGSILGGIVVVGLFAIVVWLVVKSNT